MPHSGDLGTREAVLAQIVAVAVVTALGWWDLGAKDLSLDELANLDYVTRPLSEFIKVITERQANMALHSVAMIPWAAVRDTEVWLRLPSVMAAMVTVPLLFRVGDRLLSRRAAAIAVLFFAVSPLVLEQMQTARAYTFAALASVLTTLLLIRAIESPTHTRIVAYGLAASAALYVHFVLAFVVAAHAVIVLTGLTGAVRTRFFTAGAIVAVLGAPLGIFIVVADAGQIDWIRPLSPERILVIATSVGGGAVPTAVFWGAGVAIGAAAIASRRPTSSQFILLAWFAVPILLILAVSVFKSLLVPRYFIIIIPPATLLIGAWLASLRPRVMASLIGVGLIASSVGVVEWYRAPSPKWRDATHLVVTTVEEGDEILYMVPWAERAFDYYAGRFGVHDRLPETIGLRALAYTDARRIWVVMADVSEGERLAIASALAPRWGLVQNLGFGGVSVRQFERLTE